MTRWYRAYEGTVTDPKLAEAAMVADCSRSVAVASWHLILENAAVVNDGGRVDLPSRRIAAALCEPLAVIESLVSAFAAIGLLADSHVTAWKRRQYESDSSADRVRRHRQKKKAGAGCNGDETLQPATVTPPETETDIPLPTGNGAKTAPDLSAVDVTKVIFDTGVSLLTGTGIAERQARSTLGRWRQTYSDSQVLTALSRCQVEQPSEPVGWITKTLQAEARRAAGDRNGQYQLPARETTRTTAERLAAELQASG